jgi:hypothetical protein
VHHDAHHLSSFFLKMPHTDAFHDGRSRRAAIPMHRWQGDDPLRWPDAWNFITGELRSPT